MPEARKRLADLDGEIAALDVVLGRDDGPIEVSSDLVAELVEVFAAWPHLEREERRRLLESYRIRVALRTTKPHHPPDVESIAIGVLDSRDGVRVYKKMKRLRLS